MKDGIDDQVNDGQTPLTFRKVVTVLDLMFGKRYLLEPLYALVTIQEQLSLIFAITQVLTSYCELLFPSLFYCKVLNIKFSII